MGHTGMYLAAVPCCKLITNKVRRPNPATRHARSGTSTGWLSLLGSAIWAEGRRRRAPRRSRISQRTNQYSLYQQAWQSLWTIHILVQAGKGVCVQALSTGNCPGATEQSGDVLYSPATHKHALDLPPPTHKHEIRLPPASTSMKQASHLWMPSVVSQRRNAFTQAMWNSALPDPLERYSSSARLFCHHALVSCESH